MITIGPYKLVNKLFLAPMVGVCDTPFREICSGQGAGLTIGEMLTCNSSLWHNKRNRLKRIAPRITGPKVVQIAGSDPQMMAQAARLNVELGADAIDINMGCPAKKVLQKAAGSALLRDEELVRRILLAVVRASSAPVTLKIRTGWCPANRNGATIARIAEDCGVTLLTVHGRTRQDRFRGDAEYDTIATIKHAVSIPVIANGDIDSPQKAAAVLRHTDVDGLMVGRAAQGQPWIFRDIQCYLEHGIVNEAPGLKQILRVINTHLFKLHSFYGETKGVWYARKHVGGYVKDLPGSREFLASFNTLDSASAQLEQLQQYFEILTEDEGVIAA